MRYATKPKAEIEKLCHDYCHDDEDAITAVETPTALEADPSGKRSGVYVRAKTPAERVTAAIARCSGAG